MRHSQLSTERGGKSWCGGRVNIKREGKYEVGVNMRWEGKHEVGG